MHLPGRKKKYVKSDDEIHGRDPSSCIHFHNDTDSIDSVFGVRKIDGKERT